MQGLKLAHIGNHALCLRMLGSTIGMRGEPMAVILLVSMGHASIDTRGGTSGNGTKAVARRDARVGIDDFRPIDENASVHGEEDDEGAAAAWAAREARGRGNRGHRNERIPAQGRGRGRVPRNYDHADFDEKDDDYEPYHFGHNPR
ncbi:hypothetical protein E2562_032628 [Oryza meyeriana var. granulata]|uniref:Uncharacterized protein n=1 Tax=Oryza meyeriana var. granulata TaxID=110450 RepID=A0A6G1DA03_9ORYZ|nr:hypothetical protein E2562_032628 [Oryza meyeriana var. granulata]